MEKKNGEAGSTAAAFTLALLLVIFTAITVYLFAAKVWWFPAPITAFGAQIDEQFHRTLIITGVVFVLAQSAWPGRFSAFAITGRRPLPTRATTRWSSSGRC